MTEKTDQKTEGVYIPSLMLLSTLRECRSSNFRNVYTCMATWGLKCHRFIFSLLRRCTPTFVSFVLFYFRKYSNDTLSYHEPGMDLVKVSDDIVSRWF